jgi:hypothetical protein
MRAACVRGTEGATLAMARALLRQRQVSGAASQFVASALVAAIVVGHASTGYATPPTPPDSLAPPPSGKRPVPAYGGLREPRSSVAEALRDIPRFVLSPVYVVNEQVLRRPLAVVVPAAEKADVFTKIYDFFFFGPDHKVGVVPIGSFDLSYAPTVGVYGTWKDAGVNGNNLSLNAQGWPDDALVATLKEQASVGEDRTLRLRASVLRRSDELFFGVGPASLESSKSRYFLQRAVGDASYEWRFWRSSRIETTLGVRSVRVEDGHFDGDPGIAREAAVGAFALPSGYGRAYTAETNTVVAAVDSRVPERRRGSGVRIELDGEQGSSVSGTPASGWVRWGATAAGYVDLDGYRRVLGLSVMAEGVGALGPAPIPFTELVSLGGDHAMIGYYAGRLLGESATVATLSYEWPFGPWLDGTVQLALGNTFGGAFEGFEARLLRYSAAFGMQIGGQRTKAVMGSQDAPLQVVVGIGSETFDHGGQADSIRLMAGVPVTF